MFYLSKTWFLRIALRTGMHSWALLDWLSASCKTKNSWCTVSSLSLSLSLSLCVCVWQKIFAVGLPFEPQVAGSRLAGAHWERRRGDCEQRATVLRRRNSVAERTSLIQPVETGAWEHAQRRMRYTTTSFAEQTKIMNWQTGNKYRPTIMLYQRIIVLCT